MEIHEFLIQRVIPTYAFLLKKVPNTLREYKGVEWDVTLRCQELSLTFPVSGNPSYSQENI